MIELLNPKDFVITRKRKKYKFAKFHNAENCFEFDEWVPRSVDVMEMGAGTGLFSVELAALHPDRTYLAVDVKADRLQRGAYEAIKRGLHNISFVRARADQIEQLVVTASVSEIWLTFADPYPRDRSARRRMSHSFFLEKYMACLKPDGLFRLKHDNKAFFCWSLEQLVGDGWHLTELSFNLHESALDDEYKITTSYESRWMREGYDIMYVSARKPLQSAINLS